MNIKRLSYLAIAFFILANSLWFFVDRIETRIEERENVLKVRSRLEGEANRVSNEHVLNVSAELQKISRLEDLEKFSQKAGLLSKNEREAISPILRAKLFEANFRRAELYLSRAGNLLRVDENHPTGNQYIERAKNIYDKMEKLAESGIPEQIGEYYYLKGVYYYRQLIFIKDPKKEMAKVEELIGQSAKNLFMVFKYLPKDWDTEVAIEVLQKKAEFMGAGGDTLAKIRLDLLPSNDKNKGPLFAIGGLEEGRN